MIWVVGKEGMLGTSLCSLLKEKNISFISSSKNEVDITSLDQIETFLKNKNVKTIINCAAFTNVEGAEKETQKAFLINGEASENLAKIALKTKAKLIHFSTDYVFDGKKNKPYLESDTTSALNAYGKSKQEGEDKILSILSDACIIRTSWLFGKKDKDFVSKIFSLMKQKESIQVVNDQIGRPTFAKDLAEITLRLLKESGIFHVANEGYCSWYDFANKIEEISKKLHHEFKCQRIEPIPSERFITLAKRPSYTVLSLEKINQLGLKPRNWEEALEEYLLLTFKDNHL